ncbi:MAG: apolipoprotein N-acyltransferase [Cyanobacteria bacterium SZAS LIN-3]|nr:apolipoprotein N-acyltransferase [Cyanobacteria bacterium SZAS LIN-3]
MSGTILGLACPGFEQWYLAWVGLAPFFLLIAIDQASWKRMLTAFVYGLAYNLTYLHWYLGLAPLDWLGFPGIQGNLLASCAWLIASTHQALAFGFFALAAGKIPMSGSFTFKKAGDQWQLPALVCLPLLWILIVNRICNAQDLMGVPWTQLEYTQYKQTFLLQAASIFGGIGVCALMVMVNVTLASLFATFKNKADFKPLRAQSKEAAYYHCLGAALIVAAFGAIGIWQTDIGRVEATTPVAVIQGGINIDMQKSQRTYSLSDLTKIYDGLLAGCKDELCIMTEGALPTYLKNEESTKAWLSNEAKSRNLEIVVGAMDKDGAGHPYNAAYGITSSGTFLSQVYHKRYLVPFGEYTPLLVEYFPEWIKRWTNTPAGGGFASGKEAVNFPFNVGKIAPLICFECISPEQTARSCREGGQLLVNVSDLAWFHKSDCGLQMVAFSVLRAIENRRYLVFAANTGPSAVIDTSGRISKYCPQGGDPVMKGRVGFNPHTSFFSLWYR